MLRKRSETMQLKNEETVIYYCAKILQNCETIEKITNDKLILKEAKSIKRYADYAKTALQLLNFKTIKKRNKTTINLTKHSTSLSTV